MFEVSKEIKDQTSGHCQKWRVCLSGVHFCGKVKQGGDDYLVMETSPNHTQSSCPYSYKVKDKGSDVYVCGCPVRKEIYRKYGK